VCTCTKKRSLIPSFLFQTSKDGETFEVPRNVAMMSKLLRDTFSDDEEEEEMETKEIPLPNVSAAALKKVIEYCTHFQEENMTPIKTPLPASTLKELVQPWYVDFVEVDRNLLFDLVAAANYLHIEPLLDLTCLAVCIMIKGKPAQEIRQIFNLGGELLAEELAEKQQENAKAKNGAEGMPSA